MKDEIGVKKRIHSIDLMKFLAVLLITNSHMAGLYPDSYKLLATGGAIGDSLFFFCSGFLLMNSRGGVIFLIGIKEELIESSQQSSL